MASPKSLKSASPVAPAAPDKAKDADTAQAGQVSTAAGGEREITKGTFGSVTIEPFRKEDKESAPPEQKQVWIEIELIDDDDKPIAGEPYRITLPDGSAATGTTDENGKARVEGFEPGECKVCFPQMDKAGWASA